MSVNAENLWDGETLDVRLGWLVASGGEVDRRFSAIDLASGKVYGFDSQVIAAETCGGEPCTQVLVQLTGVLRWVGPSFRYWFGDDGQLLRFEGPTGSFAAS